MKIINLFQRPWNMQGWRPFMWNLDKCVETGQRSRPEIGPLGAVLPGSAHTTLRKHELIPDWNMGLNAKSCEWVEHRHWEFFTVINAGEIPVDEEIYLLAEGLDYSGWICVDDKTVVTFCGALKRHRFDLSAALADGKEHQLRIIFDVPPKEQGQIGFTSLSKYFKPRFSYGWDWCMRLVPVGIWDQLYLQLGKCEVEITNLFTRLDSDLKTGRIVVRVRNQRPTPSRIYLTLRDNSDTIFFNEMGVAETGDNEIVFTVSSPELWWPNGHGNQYLYSLEIREAEGSATPPLYQGSVGFKFVRWVPCKGASVLARPLLCKVNGKAIFIQGINWTPVQLDYPDENPDRYNRLLDLYKDLGVNVLRVWAGAFLERDVFYRGCDKRGILVWQEFPLCSSGCDNIPPDNPAFLHELSIIARDYVRRRSHHVSLFLWCGGNELQGPQDNEFKTVPLNESHPALAALREIVAVESPGIRFLPTSPSGALFAVYEKTRGMGLHHHVHAPWDAVMPKDEWKRYWDFDDALFRAETGVTAASSVSLMKKYSGGETLWPADFSNDYWRQTSLWWIQEQLVNDQVGVPDEQALIAFVNASQSRQASYLAYAIESCQKRFSNCSGIMIWMGHDCMPFPSNTSIIDFDGNPKPAYFAIQKLFTRVMESPTLLQNECDVCG